MPALASEIHRMRKQVVEHLFDPLTVGRYHVLVKVDSIRPLGSGIGPSGLRAGRPYPGTPSARSARATPVAPQLTLFPE